MYLMGNDKNKLKIKVVSHKRAVSSKRTNNNQTIELTKYSILQNVPEPKRCCLYSIKIPTIKIPFKPVLV